MANFLPAISRRRMMIGGGAGALALAGGGAFVLSSQVEEFYSELIRYYLSSEPIAPGAAEAFAADYAGSEDMTKVRPLMYMQQVAGFIGLDEVLHGQSAYETFIRRVATNFINASTFFHRASRSVPVEYIALTGICTNPFARFD